MYGIVVRIEVNKGDLGLGLGLPNAAVLVIHQQLAIGTLSGIRLGREWGRSERDRLVSWNSSPLFRSYRTTSQLGLGL